MAAEARPYALVAATTAAATYWLFRILRGTTGRIGAVWYTAALLFTAYLHIVALSLVAGHAVVVAWEMLSRRGTTDRRGVREVAAGWVATALLVVPLVLITWPSKQAAFGRPAVNPLKLLAGFGRPAWFWASVAASTQVAVLLTTLIIIAMIAASATSRIARQLTVIAWLPMPVVAVALLTGQYFLSPRYFLFTSSAACLSAAIGVTRLADLSGSVRRSTAISILLVAAVALSGTPGQIEVRSLAGHNNSAYPGPDDVTGAIGGYVEYRKTADLLAGRTYPGDAIAYSNRGTIDIEMLDFGIGYFWPKTKQRPNDLFADPQAPRGPFIIDTTDYQRAAKTGPCRLWFVSAGHIATFDDPPGDFGQPVPKAEAAALHIYYTTDSRTELPGLTIFEMTHVRCLKPPATSCAKPCP